MLTFKHYLNFILINTINRIVYMYTCDFVKKNMAFFREGSFIIKYVLNVLKEEYGVDSLKDNDFNAIKSRIYFVQRLEEPLR